MEPVRRFVEALADRPLAIQPVSNQSLAPLTSLKAGGTAALWVQISNLEELDFVFDQINRLDVGWFLIGKGSNLICSAEPYSGVLIQLTGDFTHAQCQGNSLVAGGAAQDAKVARTARKVGCSGLEWLVTVPGTLGGAVYMNAGAHKNEIKDSLIAAQLYSPTQGVRSVDADYFDFRYRSSKLQQTGELLLSATFKLSEQDPATIKKTEQGYLESRRATQPVGIKTFGSMFRNPQEQAAWSLISQAGLQGTQIGNFRISPAHANFMENMGAGDSKGLLELIKLVQTEVYNKTGVTLQLEGKFFPPRP